MEELEQIQMNFNVAAEVADKINTAAVQIKDLADEKLVMTISSVETAYSSVNSTELLNGGMTIAEQIGRNADRLRYTSEDLLSKAQNLYDAEIKARNIAIERTY